MAPRRMPGTLLSVSRVAYRPPAAPSPMMPSRTGSCGMRSEPGLLDKPGALGLQVGVPRVEPVEQGPVDRVQHVRDRHEEHQGELQVPERLRDRASAEAVYGGDHGLEGRGQPRAWC